MRGHQFNLKRFWAIIAKEFIQMRRDRLTFGMMVGIPLLQLVLFGFAINSDPKHLPTAVFSADNSVFSRTLVQALKNSDYFKIVHEAQDEAEMRALLAHGRVQFVVHIPVDFSRKLLRGERPDILLDADATDPAATGNAFSALNQLVSTALNRDLTGPLQKLRATAAPGGHPHSSALQPRSHDSIQHRARLARGGADHDHGDYHRPWQSPANASAAPWKTSCPLPCVPGKS